MMQLSCKHYVPTPYGPACAIKKEFLRTGDLVLCVGCNNYLNYEVIMEPENLTVQKVAIVARLSDGTVRQLRLTESQEAQILGFVAAIAHPLEWYHRKLKGVGII